MSTSPPLFPPFSLSLFLHITEKSEILKRGGGGKRDDHTTPGKRVLASPQNQNKIPPPPHLQILHALMTISHYVYRHMKLSS